MLRRVAERLLGDPVERQGGARDRSATDSSTAPARHPLQLHERSARPAVEPLEPAPELRRRPGHPGQLRRHAADRPDRRQDHVLTVTAFGQVAPASGDSDGPHGQGAGSQQSTPSGSAGAQARQKERLVSGRSERRDGSRQLLARILTRYIGHSASGQVDQLLRVSRLPSGQLGSSHETGSAPANRPQGKGSEEQQPPHQDDRTGISRSPKNRSPILAGYLDRWLAHTSRMTWNGRMRLTNGTRNDLTAWPGVKSKDSDRNARMFPTRAVQPGQEHYRRDNECEDQDPPSTRQPGCRWRSGLSSPLGDWLLMRLSKRQLMPMSQAQ